MSHTEIMSLIQLNDITLVDTFIRNNNPSEVNLMHFKSNADAQNWPKELLDEIEKHYYGLEPFGQYQFLFSLTTMRQALVAATEEKYPYLHGITNIMAGCFFNDTCFINIRTCVPYFKDYLLAYGYVEVSE